MEGRMNSHVDQGILQDNVTVSVCRLKLRRSFAEIYIKAKVTPGICINPPPQDQTKHSRTHRDKSSMKTLLLSMIYSELFLILHDNKTTQQTALVVVCCPDNCFILGHNNLKINSRTTTFILQRTQLGNQTHSARCIVPLHKHTSPG